MEPKFLRAEEVAQELSVGFRVSPEENEQLNETVALSVLPKQEYC